MIQQILYSPQHPLVRLVEMTAWPELEEGLVGVSLRPFRGLAGAVLHLGHAGVAGLPLPVPDGEIQALSPPDRGMSVQPVQKPVVPEGPGNRRGQPEAAALSEGVQGKEAGQGIA